MGCDRSGVGDNSTKVKMVLTAKSEVAVSFSTLSLPARVPLSGP